MASFKLKAIFLGMFLVIIPAIYLVVLTTQFKEFFLLYETPFVLVMSVLTMIGGWLFTTTGLKVVLDKDGVLDLSKKELAATAGFGFVVAWAYASMLTVLIEISTNQEKERVIFLILGCILFLLFYPLIELYMLAESGRGAFIPGQRPLEKVVEFFTEKSGNRKAVGVMITYAIIIVAPILIFSAFVELITAIILWALFLPVIYLGILTGLKGAKDLLRWRLVRPLYAKDYVRLGLFSFSFKKEDRLWRIIPKMEVGGLTVLLFAIVAIFLMTFEAITETQRIFFGLTVTSATGLLFILQTLLIKGRGSILETIETWDRWKPLFLKGTIGAVLFPAFIGVALFTNMTLEVVANSGLLQGFLAQTGLINHLSALRLVFIMDNLLIISIMVVFFWIPSSDMQLNLIDEAKERANRGNWRPIIQLTKFNSRVLPMKWTRASKSIRFDAISAVEELDAGKAPEHEVIEMLELLTRIITTDKKQGLTPPIGPLRHILESVPDTLTEDKLQLFITAANHSPEMEEQGLLVWCALAENNPELVTPEMLLETLLKITELELRFSRIKARPSPMMKALLSYGPWIAVMKNVNDSATTSLLSNLVRLAAGETVEAQRDFSLQTNRADIREAACKSLTTVLEHSPSSLVNREMVIPLVQIITEETPADPESDAGSWNRKFNYSMAVRAWNAVLARAKEQLPEEMVQAVARAIQQEVPVTREPRSADLLLEEKIQDLNGELLGEKPQFTHGTLMNLIAVLNERPDLVSADIVRSIITIIASGDTDSGHLAVDAMEAISRWAGELISPDLLHLLVPAMTDHEEPIARYLPIKAWHAVLKTGPDLLTDKRFESVTRDLLQALVRIITTDDYDAVFRRAMMVWEIVLDAASFLATEDLLQPLIREVVKGSGTTRDSSEGTCCILLTQRPEFVQEETIQLLMEASHDTTAIWRLIVEYRPELVTPEAVDKLIQLTPSVNKFSLESIWDAFLQKQELVREFKPPGPLQDLCQLLVAEFIMADAEMQESLLNVLEKILEAFNRDQIPANWLRNNVPVLAKQCKRDSLKPRLKVFEEA
ncbi:MAG: hypothetical protein ACFFD4_24190 [Candidatus Odinarchaeota archaeon]